MHPPQTKPNQKNVHDVGSREIEVMRNSVVVDAADFKKLSFLKWRVLGRGGVIAEMCLTTSTVTKTKILLGD